MTESPPASPGPIVLWLSSRYENLELGQAVLEYVCRLRGIENDAEHWIGVALREALANAIKHGNRQDPSRRVMLSLGLPLFLFRTLVLRQRPRGRGRGHH